MNDKMSATEQYALTVSELSGIGGVFRSTRTGNVSGL